MEVRRDEVATRIANTVMSHRVSYGNLSRLLPATFGFPAIYCRHRIFECLKLGFFASRNINATLPISWINSALQVAQTCCISCCRKSLSKTINFNLINSWSSRARSISLITVSAKPLPAIVTIGFKLWPSARYCFFFSADSDISFTGDEFSMLLYLFYWVFLESVMAKSKSSNRWLQEHFNDSYVKESQRDGYRSRASYKLKELNQKDRFLKPGNTVVDLGAAPGGWSQVAAEIVGDTGKVVASDILPMDPLAGVEFICGDFTEQSVFDALLDQLGTEKADLVISDMAPNMSGIAAVDQPKSMYLVELALDMARNVLKPGGNFVAKVFQGEGFDALMSECKLLFSKVVIRKPDASRARSREVYVVATGSRT